MGSWKIMAISRPRTRRISSSESASSSLPSKRTLPPVMRPVAAGSSCMTANADTDLPEPDSPTMATISPGRTE